MKSPGAARFLDTLGGRPPGGVNYPAVRRSGAPDRALLREVPGSAPVPLGESGVEGPSGSPTSGAAAGPYGSVLLVPRPNP